MIDALRRHGETMGNGQDSDFCSPIRGGRAFHLTVWLVCAGLVALTAGCGSGSAKKNESTAGAANQSAQEEDKEAAEEAPAPPIKKKHKQKPVEIAANAEPAAPSSKDIRKWKAADLDAAFVRKDLMFVPAVVVYSMSDRNDAKRAADLDQLVRKVARMKDDSKIPLPLPPGSFAAENQPAAAKAAPAAKGLRFGFRRSRKQDKEE
jgi:hypothetical protein